MKPRVLKLNKLESFGLSLIKVSKKGEDRGMRALVVSAQ